MGQTSLDPATWDAAEVEDFLLRSAAGDARMAATGTANHTMVVGSIGPFAQLAGRRALELGGSAVDATVTTALTQIALAAGSWVSYAGIFTMVCFEAASGTVSSLSAGFGTFREETDPASIPEPPAPSGRSALVPGFLAGVEAAHRRFGTLPWADLFQPALFVAEHGFPVGRSMAWQFFQYRAEVLARTPEGQGIFFDADGKLPQVGDTFRQPQLAETLRRVAAEGAEYIYHGPWAAAFVEQVRRAGGRATLEDLAAYRPLWSEPLHGLFHGYDIHSLGAPDIGGPQLIEALHLVEEAGLGDPTTSWEALYWLIQISRQGPLLRHIPPTQRVARRHARQVWQQMHARGGVIGGGRVPREDHSDFVLVADQAGNVVAACHSINTMLWGSTGLFVGGISIPDSASFRQPELCKLMPGAHLPSVTSPTIITKAATPVLASSSIGGGLSAVALQCLVAMLGRGLDIEAALHQPLFHGGDFTLRGSESISQAIAARIAKERHAGTDPLDVWPNVFAQVPEVVEDTFDQEVLAQVQAAGLPLVVQSSDGPTISRGYWGGISIDVPAGTLRGGRTAFLHGSIEGS